MPHAFQQKLSAEKTPTLGDALPAFEAMIKIWQRQQVQHPETAHIIQKGIDKLTAYQERVEDVPAYTFAMSELNILFFFSPTFADWISSFESCD